MVKVSSLLLTASRAGGRRENHGTSLTETYLCDPDSRLVAPF